jgi:hypothetical protein
LRILRRIVTNQIRRHKHIALEIQYTLEGFKGTHNFILFCINTFFVEFSSSTYSLMAQDNKNKCLITRKLSINILFIHTGYIYGRSFFYGITITNFFFS